MAHFAKLDSNNYVTDILFIKNEDFRKNIKDEESEGIEYLQSLFGADIRWVRTSYNTTMGTHRLGGTPFRGKYAEIGDIYNEDKNLFIPPKPYPSWILDENTCTWFAPVPKPDEGRWYQWDEENQRWVFD